MRENKPAYDVWGSYGDPKPKAKNKSFLKRIATAILLCCVAFSVFGLVGCTPKSPEGLEIALSESYATVTWQATQNATSYTVEYDYGEESTRETKVTEETSLKILRYTGTLRVRVSAKTNKGDSPFSDWKAEEIPAVPLQAPQYQLVFLLRNPADRPSYYQASRNRGWEPVKVWNGDEEETVEYYQVAVVAPNGDVDTAMQNALTCSREELFEHEFNFDDRKKGTWRIYVRAVNYTWFNGQIVPEPEYLYRRYAVSDQWRMSTIEVA